MKTIAAPSAAEDVERLLEEAQREPVTIEWDGRAVAVLMSSAEYSRLTEHLDETWTEADEELEDELLKGLSSGPATSFTPADWADIDRQLESHVARQHRAKSA